MTETIQATQVGQIIVEDETGEILEWPEGINDVPARLAHLTALKRECTEQEKAWKSRGAFLGKLAQDILVAQGIDRWTSDTGRLLLQTRTTRRVDVNDIPNWTALNEIPLRTVDEVVLESVSALDADRFVAACKTRGITEGVAEALIDQSSTTFVTAKAAPKPAEKPRKVEVKA